MRHGFIYTFAFLSALALMSIYYIVNFLMPTWYFATILFVLTGFAVSAIFSIIYFLIKLRTLRFETERSLFRKGFRKGLFVGLFVVILLLLQLFFDLI